MSDVSSIIASDSVGQNVFKGLSNQELDRIMRRTTRVRVAAKAPIFQIGDLAENVLIIESGRVRTIYTAADGQEYTTGIWSRGYAVGLISAIMASPYRASGNDAEMTGAKWHAATKPVSSRARSSRA